MQVFNPNHIVTQLDEMEFHELDAFNEGGSGVFWALASDWSPWEMHPDCEELLHVIEGEITLEVLPFEGDDKTRHSIKTGDFITIPRGLWHRQKIRCKTKEYYLTPGKTLHSHEADPRINQTEP